MIRILNPVNVAAMNDERQTAMLIRATDEYTDVAFTLFPLIEPEARANPNWRDDVKDAGVRAPRRHLQLG